LAFAAAKILMTFLLTETLLEYYIKGENSKDPLRYKTKDTSSLFELRRTKDPLRYKTKDRCAERLN